MDTDYETIILETGETMEKAVSHTLHEFSTLHTGKASPSMVESLAVTVEAYGGSSMQLKELAAITTPDLRTIQIQPWDRSVIREVERAIQTANLGFNPIVNGTLIRIPIPELSGDRRRALVKMAYQKAEDGRIGIRHARHEALRSLKSLRKAGEISEDDLKRYEEDVQEETDQHIKEIAEHLKHKEKELTTV